MKKQINDIFSMIEDWPVEHLKRLNIEIELLIESLEYEEDEKDEKGGNTMSIEDVINYFDKFKNHENKNIKNS